MGTAWYSLTHQTPYRQSMNRFGYYHRTTKNTQTHNIPIRYHVHDDRKSSTAHVLFAVSRFRTKSHYTSHKYLRAMPEPRHVERQHDDNRLRIIIYNPFSFSFGLRVYWLCVGSFVAELGIAVDKLAPNDGAFFFNVVFSCCHSQRIKYWSRV